MQKMLVIVKFQGELKGLWGCFLLHKSLAHLKQIFHIPKGNTFSWHSSSFLRTYGVRDLMYFFFQGQLREFTLFKSKKWININSKVSGPKEADAWLETFLVSLTSIYPCKQWFPPALGKERTKQNRNTFLWNFLLYSPHSHIPVFPSPFLQLLPRTG